MTNFILREVNSRDRDSITGLVSEIRHAKSTIVFVEGTIGVGKTTFMDSLPKDMPVVPEPVDKFHAIIDKFYKGELSPEETSTAIKDICRREILSRREDVVVVERIPEARNYIFSLKADDVKLGNTKSGPRKGPMITDLYSEMISNYGLYDTIIVVLLTDDIGTIMSNIKKRGRKCEEGISSLYVEAIAERTKNVMEGLLLTSKLSL